MVIIHLTLHVLLIVIVNSTIRVSSQIYLRANQSMDTYSLINSVFGGIAVEVPDCVHTIFGQHIRQQFDNELKRDVFAFHIHVTPDNDRCQSSDRQRVEIKTHPSVKYLKGREGETVSFSWNFKLDAKFQPSKAFTCIHQLKSTGGDDRVPLIAVNLRLANLNKLQLIHVDSTGLKTIRSTTLAPFLGEWIHVKENVTYSTNGKYSIRFSRVNDDTEIFAFSTDSIDLWRRGAQFVRPKWGIYRGLTRKYELRDETVLFDTICLAKGNDICF